MKIDINDLTLGQVKEMQALFGDKVKSDNSAWVIGGKYLIRTVTVIRHGKLVAVTDQELVLEDAAWIANTGRFADAIAKATFKEVEPFPDGRVIIGRGAIIDAVLITETPRSTK